MYVQYVQGIQPNVPACTKLIELYNHSSGLFNVYGKCPYLQVHFYLWNTGLVTPFKTYKHVFYLQLNFLPTDSLGLQGINVTVGKDFV